MPTTCSPPARSSTRRSRSTAAPSGSTRHASCSTWRSSSAAGSRSTPTRTRPANWSGNPSAATAPPNARCRSTASSTRCRPTTSSPGPQPRPLTCPRSHAPTHRHPSAPTARAHPPENVRDGVAGGQIRSHFGRTSSERRNVRTKRSPPGRCAHFSGEGAGPSGDWPGRVTGRQAARAPYAARRRPAPRRSPVVPSPILFIT